MSRFQIGGSTLLGTHKTPPVPSNCLRLSAPLNLRHLSHELLSLRCDDVTLLWNVDSRCELCALYVCARACAVLGSSSSSAMGIQTTTTVTMALFGASWPLMALFQNTFSWQFQFLCQKSAINHLYGVMIDFQLIVDYKEVRRTLSLPVIILWENIGSF